MTTRTIFVTALLALTAGPAAAQVFAPVPASSDTFRLGDALELARQANPSLQAARLRVDAARQRVPQAGAWSDPLLSVGFMNRPVNDLGSTAQPMTMNTIGLTQMVPWPGKLGFGEERAEFLVQADSLDTEEIERDLLARVTSIYYQLAYIDRALGIMDETRDLLRDFFEVSSARYAVGAGLQQDVLQAQVSVAQMTEDITVMKQERLAMAARLNALLGRMATVPVGDLELPAAGSELPAVDELMALAAEGRPALKAAQQRILAAEAGYRAARRELYPDIMVNLSYGARPQFDDFVTLMFGVRIPLFAGSRALPQRREMRAMQRMEEARALDLYNDTFARLAELRAQAERARNLSRLYVTSILPQAQAAVESALSAYRVGRIDYTTLVVNEMTVNRYQIESVRLTAEYHRAVAQVEALVGAAFGEDR
ncbi:MAG TPA: TolC family protein [Gemmatimonadota bacterium]|nr:TolC family protein [Gemmatimonadota bacterium]